jgi:hypothetical protein
MLSLSVYEPVAVKILHRGSSPNIVRRAELGGRLWYPVKVLHAR